MPEDDDHEETTDDDSGEPAGDGDHVDDPRDGDEPSVLERLAKMEQRFEQLAGIDDEREEPTVPAGVTREGVDIRSQVRAALAEVGEERELKERVEKIEKVVEKPPVKQSRLSRARWGKVDA